MEKSFAIRLDGMVTGAQGLLNTIAFHVKENCEDKDSEMILRMVGSSMTSLLEISNRLYQIYPDILPNHLNPELDKDN